MPSEETEAPKRKPIKMILTRINKAFHVFQLIVSGALLTITFGRTDILISIQKPFSNKMPLSKDFISTFYLIETTDILVREAVSTFWMAS